MESQIHYATAESSLGIVMVAESERGVCAISLGNEASLMIAELRKYFPAMHIQAVPEEDIPALASVISFLEEPTIDLQLRLDLHGTPFQQNVWKALSQIEVGSTRIYSQIAASMGAPKAVRAVAAACGANKIAIAIPCHRVIQKDGSLAGYHWGIERKQALLQREAAIKNR